MRHCQCTIYVYNVADSWDRRRATPVTRERVVKGPSVNHKPPPIILNVVTKESANLQAAREFQASLGSSSKQSKIRTKGTTGSVHGSQSSQSLVEDRSAKVLAKPPRPRYMAINEHHHLSLTLGSPVTQVELASPEAFMAIARIRANIPRTAEQPAQQPKMATVQSSASAVARPIEVSAPKVKISLPTITQQITSGKVAVTTPNKVKTSPPSRKNQSAVGILPATNANAIKASEQPVPEVSRPQSPQQSSNPGLDPMGHLRALQESGLLSKELTDLLDNAIRAGFHAQDTAKPSTEAKLEVRALNDAVDVNAPSRPVIYTQTELKALRPKAETNSPPKVSLTARQTSDTTGQAEKTINPFAAPAVPLEPTGVAKTSRGLSQRLADQRKALIGEHIHRTRFQPPVHFLIEGFRKLSLHDHTNTESATGISNTTSAEPSKATENPFGSSKSINPTPELPSHLRKQAAATDHGAAVRAQYGIGNPLGAPKPRASGPELPHHLRNVVPAADHGAAVRAQYGIPDFTAPGSKTQTKTQTESIAGPKSSETSPQRHRRSQTGANTSPTARPSASKRSGPSLPAFLRGQTAGDTGAAARAQYGGETLAPPTNKRTPSSTILKEDIPARSKPQLPAHLRGQTAGDPGAAVRAQYGNVLAPVTNSLKPSSTSSKGEPPSPPKPCRGSKVNTSGFIGLAQAARNNLKEDDDPIKIASSKGF